ncbi:fibronectin type III domain-containing protein [Salinispora pacifica]|uniref:fibronectin type III domain-containing protein n=1 Tax=Salinispora pacifica TaxID=351187 RepID=UPI00138E5108|nr:fibronectin type III domain-containing protein [Salinispora pacifica]
MYLRVYVRVTDGWRFDDNQNYSISGTGGGTGTYHNSLDGTGATKLIYSKNFTASISHSGGPTYSWTAAISGMYNGGTPRHTRSLSLPARPPSAPSAPGTPTASSVTATSARLSWSTPSNNGRSLDYNAGQLSRNSAFTDLVHTWSTPGWGTIRTIVGLPPGTTLYARVRARNSVGWGSYSGSRAFTTSAKAPSAPTTPSFSTITATTASVSWYAPSDTGGASITGYEIARSVNPSFTDVTTVTDSASPATLSGLLPGTTYYIRIRAINAVGVSPWSPTASATTLSGVKVGDGARWRDAIVWIGSGTRWVMTQVRAGDGSTWR